MSQLATVNPDLTHVAQLLVKFKNNNIRTQLKRPFGGFSGKDQRYKFGLVTRLLGYISDLIEISLQEHKVSASAMAYNLKYAVTGVSPDFSINLPQLSFNRGKFGPESIAAEGLAGAKVKFTWTNFKIHLMARLKNGIFWGIQGVVGNLEGYILNGKYIVRSRRRKSTKPPSEKQLACRKRLAVVNKFLSGFIPYVQVGFAYTGAEKGYTGYHAATGYQIKQALTGQYPDYIIDYTKVRLTEGPMSNENINAAVVRQNNYLVFSWTADLSYKHSSDRVMLLAYAPALNEAVYTLCGAKRMDGRDVLLLPDSSWKEKVIEIYLSFVTEDRKQCTNSLYLGQMFTGVY
ncbi:hypothetical protein SAMN05428988_4958 [Chitinophaga sp. YR573]|uniref:DUF6266 family protein n=1 Tax=Chitinophaga sp. YR573 TaxID=1881040 RepID=UPI0008CB1BB0|nr:DUF6266 family protein [Chitinophaga sp. YR573]SEW38961.1 hypothetical protein SAMN05428988_4958 [Chitinophaga sp. YR573]